MLVGIYARVSTGSEEQENALEQQLDRLNKAATARGVEDPMRYVDIASGTKDDRPELSRLMGDCVAGLVTEVIVTRLDRLSRSSSHGAELLKYFSRDNTPNLTALDDSLDLNTTGGRFMAQMLVSWAEAESDRLAERTRHGHAYRRKQRKVFGPRSPFGYQFDGKGGLEADPETFSTAQELIRRFIAGESLGALRKWCLEERGHRFSTNFALRRWLTLPTLCGARAYRKRQSVLDPKTGNKKKVERPPGDYGEIYWLDENDQPFQPPLMSREQHAFVLSVFHARAGVDTRPLEGKRTRPLTGLITCGDCGRVMEHHRAGKKGPLSLRCKTLGCPSRWKTIRAEETAIAMFAFLQRHAAQLVELTDEIRAAQEGKLSVEEKALGDQIQQLEGMNDPDLRTVLDKKREMLSQMIKAKSSNSVEVFTKQVAEFEGIPPKRLLQEEPAVVRRLLQQFCRAEAAKGELTFIYVAERIRRPDQGRAISVEGFGFGQSRKKMLAKLETQPD